MPVYVTFPFFFYICIYRGNAFFHGPWFVTPQEVQHPPTRLFFKQEVFLSSIEDTNPLLSVIGRCAVLEYKGRPRAKKIKVSACVRRGPHKPRGAQ